MILPVPESWRAKGSGKIWKAPRLVGGVQSHAPCLLPNRPHCSPFCPASCLTPVAQYTFLLVRIPCSAQSNRRYPVNAQQHPVLPLWPTPGPKLCTQAANSYCILSKELRPSKHFTQAIPGSTNGNHILLFYVPQLHYTPAPNPCPSHLHVPVVPLLLPCALCTVHFQANFCRQPFLVTEVVAEQFWKISFFMHVCYRRRPYGTANHCSR